MNSFLPSTGLLALINLLYSPVFISVIVSIACVILGNILLSSDNTFPEESEEESEDSLESVSDSLESEPIRERSFSLRKKHLVDISKPYACKTYQKVRPELINARDLEGSPTPEKCASPPASIPVSRRSLRLRGPGRTSSCLNFEDELCEEKEEKQPELKSQKRMLIEFKVQRERKVVWDQINVDTLPKAYKFNVGDTVWLDSDNVADVREVCPDGLHYIVQMRGESGEKKRVPHSKLELCVKILVKEPTEEQVAYFETFSKTNKNLLKSCSNSHRR